MRVVWLVVAVGLVLRVFISVMGMLLVPFASVFTCYVFGRFMCSTCLCLCIGLALC